MSAKASLGPHQERWLQRIREAGGIIEVDIYRNGHPVIWIPIEGGPPVRLPVRMFESLVQRDLFELQSQDESSQRWSLVEGQESGG